MYKRLLFIVALFTYNLTLSQAPGDDCGSATALILVANSTISTGQQTTAGLADDFAPADFDCLPGPYGSSPDGVYSINVITGGEYNFEFTNYGTTWKSLSIHNVCPAAPGNCVGNIATGGFLDGSTGAIYLNPGVYYLVIDGWSLFNSAGVNFELEITNTNDNPLWCRTPNR